MTPLFGQIRPCELPWVGLSARYHVAKRNDMAVRASADLLLRRALSLFLRDDDACAGEVDDEETLRVRVIADH